MGSFHFTLAEENDIISGGRAALQSTPNLQLQLRDISCGFASHSCHHLSVEEEIGSSMLGLRIQGGRSASATCLANLLGLDLYQCKNTPPWSLHVFRTLCWLLTRMQVCHGCGIAHSNTAYKGPDFVTLCVPGEAHIFHIFQSETKKGYRSTLFTCLCFSSETS